MKNKEVVEAYYEAFNGRHLDRLDSLSAPDFRGHAGAGADLSQLKASLNGFFEGFPDMVAKVRYLISEEDLVSSWVSYVGTHQNTFAGVPGSGRAVNIAGWDLFRVKDGRIAELTQFCDLFTLMNQMGALPTTAPA